MIWHSSDAEMVIKELEADREKGLESIEVMRRLERFGKNEIHDFEKPDFLKIFLKQLIGYVNIIMIVLAAIYLAVTAVSGDISWTEPLLIILLLLLSNLAGAAISFRNIKKVDKLRNAHQSYSTVIRDGSEQSIPSSNIVPGDILLLSEGDYIAADGRIIDTYVFMCDEFSVSGESVPVEKLADLVLDDITPLKDRTNMVYAGSYVRSGRATVVVTETGTDTAAGRAETIVRQIEPPSTPLLERLRKIGKILSTVSLICGALVFLAGVIANIKNHDIGFETTVLGYLLLGISLTVSAIPDGLPTVLEIAVCFSAQRLQSRNVIFKKLPFAESIGSTSVICTDKTGALTDENMNLVKITNGTEVIDLTRDRLTESAVTLLHLALICSNLDDSDHIERHSNSVEAAIERASAKATGMGKADIDGIYPRLAELPFDSARMLMTTVTVINTKPYAVIKGAPEVVAERCLDIDKDAVTKTINSFADEGLKVMAVALKPLEAIPVNPNSEELENGLIFVGLLAFDNPLDPLSVREISGCRAKGIRVVMLTGDYPRTAVATALRLGIIFDSSEAITHSEIMDMSDEELEEAVLKYSVFSRVTAEDKLRVVKALRARSHEVLITCDTVDDLPALKEADYGCALGITASDSVKSEADLIVSDNKFSSLILALKESNRIFDSVLRSIKYLISCNATEIVTVLFGIIIFGISPIGAAALLWINFVTDFLVTLAFSGETASSTLSLRRHESRELLNIRGAAGIAVPTVIMSVLTIIAYAVGLSTSSGAAAALAFTVMSVCETTHAFTLSHTYTVFQKGTIRNLVMPLACLLSTAITLLVALTPVGALLSFEPFGGSGWLMVIIAAAVTLITGEVIKFINKKYAK